MLSIFSNIMVVGFAIPIAYNAVKLTLSHSKIYNYQEKMKIKEINKKRRKRILILIILLPFSIFFLFFGNYLLNH